MTGVQTCALPILREDFCGKSRAEKFISALPRRVCAAGFPPPGVPCRVSPAGCALPGVRCRECMVDPMSTAEAQSLEAPHVEGLCLGAALANF